MPTGQEKITLAPLTAKFGVDVSGVDLSWFASDETFPVLRRLFDAHSALLFREADWSEEIHMRLARLFGPLEDRLSDERAPGEAYQIPEVTNIRADGAVSGAMDLQTLDLQCNFQWHCDSTFLPVPALVNILKATIVPSSGGATELASTRAAWAEMPEALKSKVRDRGVWHRYSHSRKKISEELSRLPKFNKWPDQRWKSVWTNPTNGEEALYIASHAFKIDGYDEAESEAILDELTAFCTQPQYVYSHQWRVGDVLLWDQRAALHRGAPWPFEEPRKLTSTCSSVQDSDGLAAMRVT